MQYEKVKLRKKRAGSGQLNSDWQALNEEHVLGPARCVNVRALRFHLSIDHNVSVGDARTALALGRIHLLAHACMAHPDLRELLSLPPEWGTGKNYRTEKKA